jgi:hypothetical protein
MEKLLLLIHGKPITDWDGEDNVGAGHTGYIEMAFSKLKALLRARAERSVDALWDTVGSRSSNRRNVQTTSQQPDMTPIKMDAL